MRLRRRRRSSGIETTCQQATSLIAAYLDGVLPPVDRVRLETHLKECEHCEEHLKQLEVTRMITGEIRTDVLDPLAREDLMDLFRRWRDDTPRR